MSEMTPQPAKVDVPPLDATVTARLHRVASKLRSYLFVEGVAWVLGFLLVAGALQLLIDYAARGLRWSMRFTLLMLIVAGALAIVWRRLLRPLRVPIGEGEVAHLIERRHPQLFSALVSSVRFTAGEVGDPETNSPELMARVVERANEAVRSCSFDTVLNPMRARRSGFVIGGVLMIGVLAGLAAPGTLGLWFTRNVLLQEVAWPRQTQLVVDLENGEIVAARGDDVVIQASAIGVAPRSVEFTYVTESGKDGREMMATIGTGGSYRYVFKNAQEDFRFFLKGGDARTDEFRARLIERPRLTSSNMIIRPPAYTRLEQLVLEDGQRTAQVLPGTLVELSGQVNKPIASAKLMAGSIDVAPTLVEVDRVTVDFSPEETHTYHFALVDEFGLDNRQPLRFSIRVLKDEPPNARLRIPSAGSMITPQAILPLEAEFADTYGLAWTEIIYRTSREGSQDQSLGVPGFEPYATHLTSSLSWPVASAALAPGDGVTLFARASDFNDVSGPGVSQSPEVTLRVVTTEEFLAELARREQEYRMDFERLVDAQEALRSDLLTAFGRFNQANPPMNELAAALVPLERRQRNIVGSVNAIRQQFEQILAELRVNQLASRDVEERLGIGVVEPLTRLARRELVLAADLIRQWSRSGSAETASQVDPRQAEVLLQMRLVLSRMIQWEGYQEAINMLRDILRLENELREETRKKLEAQAGDVFED
jgi:hypothetical protein